MNALQVMFEDFLRRNEKEGSNKVRSYLKALHIIGPLLKKQMDLHGFRGDLYALDREALKVLHDYVHTQMHSPNGGDFKNLPWPSYWKNRFGLAAMSALIEFVGYRDERLAFWNRIETAEYSDTEDFLNVAEPDA